MPSAHPRRSIFCIHVDVCLSRGSKSVVEVSSARSSIALLLCNVPRRLGHTALEIRWAQTSIQALFHRQVVVQALDIPLEPIDRQVWIDVLAAQPRHSLGAPAIPDLL